MYLELWNNCQKVAAHWDKEFPGWWRSIDLKKLDMSDTSACLLYQGVMANTTNLKNYIKEQDILAVNHCNDKKFCKKLDQYWTTLIKQRQKNE